jgi:hypothetical protein
MTGNQKKSDWEQKKIKWSASKEGIFKYITLDLNDEYKEEDPNLDIMVRSL